jgi:hypothetical protein
MRGVNLSTAFIFGMLGSVLLSLSPNYSLTQDKTADIEPLIRLEKPKYVLGEAVRFWIGVKRKNSPVIAQEFRKPCSLTITKPDGTIEKQAVGWAADGSMDRGWYGGWGLGKDQVIAGTYILILDCAGVQTRPVELTVERINLPDQIKAQFVFERSGTVNMGTQIPVTLTVQNNSEYTIQFPERGVVGEGISVGVFRHEPEFHADLFYPWEKLSNSPLSYETYSWDMTATIPSIVLKPGEHFVQRFSVQEAYSFDQPGQYEITFTTVLPILAGEKNGPFADLCPIRLPVRNNAQFAVTDSR